ncbi:hypothetical protein WR25_21328 [Diploscapter pachys]|uniref:Shugoshin C-terminal domain-containing protein n=1 Tax=Diploscapter pachys TaxID=2018661 RepID=A0A2A2J407_9BILA|nr:hypothetical protein WR25_21328 [Diploscapter pachys]
MASAKSRSSSLSSFYLPSSSRNNPTNGNASGDYEELKRNNQQLIKKVVQQKTEIEHLKVMVKELREESSELKRQNAVFLSGTEDEQIELIVADRLRKKSVHFLQMCKHTAASMAKTTADLQEFVDQFDELAKFPSHPSIGLFKAQKRSVSQGPDLDSVTESPLVRVSAHSAHRAADSGANLDNILIGQDPDEGKENEQVDDEETPKATSSSKGRRSSLIGLSVYSGEPSILFGAGVSTRKTKSTMPSSAKKDDSANENAVSPDGSDDNEERRTQPGEDSSETVDGDDKARDTANATAAPIDEEFSTPVATVRHRKARRDTPDSSTSSTSNNADDQVATTGRRKRTASMKIQSFAEPKLNNKMRRPDKLDAPSPYIKTSY